MERNQETVTRREGELNPAGDSVLSGRRSQRMHMVASEIRYKWNVCENVV